MSKPLSVLIVEDHDPLRQILKELMRSRGWSPLATGQVDAARDLARRLRPDFALLDFHLQGQSGLDLFRDISAEIGPMPSIMMSGEATATEADAALDAGVFSFLRKPIEMPHLLRALDLLVAKHFPSPGGPAGPVG